jgi:alkanesulfonate monooxygenase SsuD/methylene tetrahydromethanopterin reductase-like flavin-dependent oxidoreductase (luciferase family)
MTAVIGSVPLTEPLRPAGHAPAPPAQAGSGPRFGLYLPQLRMSIDQIEEIVRGAESLGFHSVWFMDHLAPPSSPDLDSLEGWTVAAALARRTERIRIGHLVLADALRHPAVLAKMAVTLDVITEGRFDLGLGWGSDPDELRRYGITTGTARERALRLAETLEILERMFTGQPFSFRGRNFQLEDAVGRPTPTFGRIPIHIGGAGRKLTMPIVRRYADWWNCPSYAADELTSLRPLAGSARVSVQHPVGMASNRHRLEEVRAQAERRFGNWGGLVVGTPQDVAQRFVDEAQAGAELFIVQFSDFASSGTLRLFAREVMPAVTAAVR